MRYNIPTLNSYSLDRLCWIYDHLDLNTLGNLIRKDFMQFSLGAIPKLNYLIYARTKSEPIYREGERSKTYSEKRDRKTKCLRKIVATFKICKDANGTYLKPVYLRRRCKK